MSGSVKLGRILSMTSLNWLESSCCQARSIYSVQLTYAHRDMTPLLLDRWQAHCRRGFPSLPLPASSLMKPGL